MTSSAMQLKSPAFPLLSILRIRTIKPALAALALGWLGLTHAALGQLPAGWTDADIGSPGLAGSASYSAGNWTVAGSGADIWNTSDQFNFAYQNTTNNVIIARVTAIQNTTGWAKSGVMFRDSADPASVFVNVVITPANGVNLQWRSTYSGSCGTVGVSGISAPIWVKLVRANNVFTAYYGSDGVNWTQIGTPQTVAMNNPQLAGLCVTAHANTALNTSTFANVSLSYVAPAAPPPPPTFGVYRELWTGLNSGLGNTLSALTNTANNPNWPNNPNAAFTKSYTNYEAEWNTGINYYGQRLRAFVVPPTNGNYIFWISSDDASELWLSQDESPANRARVAWVSGWTDYRQWNKYAEQQSAPVPLEGGRRYYLEALMQQGSGGDNLSVRWELPDYTFEEPLPATSAKGTCLMPCTGVDTLPGIYRQTTNISVVEGLSATISVLCTNQSAVAYQWRLAGANVPGATKAVYPLGAVSMSDNGKVFTCGVSNSVGGVLSGPITLTVLRDLVPPALQRVLNVGTTSVQVVFTKLVEPASATNTANYHFTNGLAITGAALGADNMSVMLTTAPLVYGSNYTILISNVRDRASIPNTIAANTPANFTATPYTPQDIGSPSPATSTTFLTNGLNIAAGGADIGGANDQFGLNYQPRTGDFDVAVRLAGISLSDVWAKAGLMARETPDPGSRFAATLTTPTMAGSFFEWRDPAFSQANMTGRFPGNFPNGWVRLRRSGNTFTGFASYDGQTWTQLGSAVITMPAQIYVGLVVSSHKSGLATTAQFRDMMDVTNAVVGTIVNPHEPLGPSSRRTPIVISEIMYKPAPRADTNNVEFVELYNSNPYFEDISGFQLAGGSISFTFPTGTILPGGSFLVVAASPANMQTVYGITNVTGPYVGSLKKAGSIQLVDNIGAVLLMVPYSNLNPWPAGADGTGHSLVLANPTYGEGDPRAWDISDVVSGSPGMAETFRPSPLRNVVINEFLAHTDPPQYDYIELYNHANQPVNISGCVLTDKADTNKFVIPIGTIIPARGFVWFSETNMNFSLSSFGETIFFKNPDGSRVLDAVQFEGQENGVSMGRWPDGASDFYRLAALTPGAPNAAIRQSDVVINELMYKPISGDDDDQYIELYNRSANTVDLSQWQVMSAVNFTFPSNTVLAPDNYLVIARNAVHLRTNYANLTTANCLGDYSGKLNHKGDRVALAMPHYDLVTNGTQVTTAITMHIVVNEVTYGTGGRWGQWAAGGGSSLELKDPDSNNRLAANWGDSDETAKSVWTNLEYTGVLDLGANYNSAPIDQVQVGLLEAGECLVDNLEVRPGVPTGANIVANSDFESGLTGWSALGDHSRSDLETAGSLGGYLSSQSLHLRATDAFWTLADHVRSTLTSTSLAAGQTVTLRLKARWLHGRPEVLMRLRGNWLEVSGVVPVPANLGTPGQRNSCYVANAGPAIYEVKHSPPLPAVNQALVVSARFHDFNGVSPTLLYRVDTAPNPAPSYTSVAMVDNGTGGDAIAGDGLYSATIPAQPQGTVVAFVVQAVDGLGVTTIFPADLNDHSGLPRECVVAFGDPIPTGSFSHHHVFLTQNWAQRWAQFPGACHEVYDGTWVDGGGRIVYNWRGRFAGSPYHQYLGSPITAQGGMHWLVPDDDQVFGTTSLNKQHMPGNGPLDDNTLQREQASFWMARQIGLRIQNRRYYFYYVNGNRHGPLMEDAQAPGGDMLKEYWPDDDNGWLFKNHVWFEGDAAPQANGYINFNNASWCTLGKYTTTINGVPNQYKLARYRWMWWIHQYPGSANDFSQVYALIDAANAPTGSPSYYANLEALVDTEAWLRWSAMEHATGDWDSFFTQNQWNMYCYKPTMGKWTPLKWDWNITLGSGTQTWPSDGSQLFNVGANDPVMATFQNYPAYRRTYLRALQDIANLAMNNALVDPVLDAKYAAFVANGLTANSDYGLQVQEPGSAGLKSWIGSMHNSLLSTLASQGVSNVPFNISSTVVSNDVALVNGTAPVAVKTIWFNGAEYPLVWTSVTNWTATIPLHPGTNTLNVVGVDLHNQPVPGASTVIAPVYNGSLPSPAGQVVINELMFDPAVPGAEYVELFNVSTNLTFDLSGWQLRGLNYTFPAGSAIGPNGYLVLAADPSAFATAYGGLMTLFDTYPGNLSANGERLLLVRPGTNSASDLVVAGVRYRNAPPWTTGANGTASSLQLIDPTRDNWRVGNWNAVQTNVPATPQWVFVTTNITSTSSTLYIYLGSPGDIYIDDMRLVGSAGTNVLANGNFEAPLAGTWSLSPNFASSTLSTVVRHGGNASLHVVATAAGTGSGNAVYQVISPALGNNKPYTLSFWYLQSTNGGPLTVRLSSSAQPVTLNPVPPLLGPSVALATPDAANSVLGQMAAFPSLWINELQADNLTGITNSAGQRAAWLELFNPSTNTVPLNGLYLANNYTNLLQWAFPTNATIGPGQFKTIFADGQTSLSTLIELHTSFVLSSGSGSLALSRVTTNAVVQVLDYIDYTNLIPNHSFGVSPDGQAFYRQEFFYVTPGATNDPTIPSSFVAYTNAGSVYVQAFDLLPNPGVTSVNAANPVTINGVTYSLGNPFDFSLPAMVSGSVGGLGLTDMAGWYGRAALGSKFGATAGDQTTGGVLSFGLPGSGNRALGLLATSSTGPTAFGVKLINQTALTLDTISLQVTGEAWRQSNLPKTLAFHYYIDVAATNTFPTNYTASLPALNVAFPVVPADVGGVAVDGTAALNQTNLSVIGQTITNWPPGAALWLVWDMTDPAGKAQGLAIDNLSFSATQGHPVNTAPILTTIGNQSVYANTLLTFNATATDADLPPQSLTFTLGPGAPAGAAITPNGLFTWTPTAAQAPSTNVITVIVTDSGTPPLSDSQSFTVVVFAPNTRPQLSPILSQAIYANTVLTFTASATDTDQPPQSLTFSLGPGAPAGADITTGGLFGWTPTAAQAPSTNLISVIVTDSGAPQMSATNSFSVVVYRPNTPPVLTALSNRTVYANTLLSFTAGATDADQPPQSLTFSLGAGAPTGASITPGGAFTWTPTAAQAPSTNLILVIVSDSGVPQMSATNSFSVVVYRPNTPPVLTAISNRTVYANSLLSFTVSATDTDQPPQSLTFSLGSGAPSGVTITTNGLFTWTPTAAQAPSTNLISVIVSDSGVPQMSATNSFSVVVYRPNTPPSLAALSDRTVYANTPLSFTASATDTDQPPQSLTFSLGAGAPSGASITTNGLFTWTPTTAQAPSTNLISVIVTDSGTPQMSTTNSFSVVVYRPNTAPSLAAIADRAVYANTLLSFTSSATDTDQPPQSLTFSLGAGAPTGASISPGGAFTWTPTAGQAPSTNLISVIVTDSGTPQMSATNSFSVVVYRPNTAPSLAAISSQTVYASTLLSFTASATDTDQPPQSLTFSLGAGAPSGASITPGGAFTWTPTAAQAPITNLISVIVTDSGTPQMSATNSFSVVVYRPNTAPSLSALSDRTVYANTLLSFAVSATDTDQPPQSLTFSLGAGAPSGASITSGGVFSWTPTVAQAPSTNLISVIVSDSGTPQMSATNSFSVVVYRPNTAPSLATLSDRTVYANTPLSFAVSATDTDQPPQSLTFSLGAGAPTGASITSGGVFSWTPTAAQAPSTNLISVIVSDSGTPQMSATNSFSVVVYRPNTAPSLATLSDRTVYANTPLSFAVSATDTDQPPQSLTFSLGAGAPTGASITSGGVFSWTPTAAQAPSTNLISVIVSDSGTPQMSATNSFSVVVYRPNTAPNLATLSDRTVYANTPLSFAVSATDTDQPPQSLTFSLGAGAPTGASITPGGAFTWTPTAAQAPSTNLISVIVTDSGTPQMSATNSFSVVVYRPNTAPNLIAISDRTVYASTLLSFAVNATDTDQPPQSLTLSLGAGTPSGASISPSGLFTWTPTAAQAPSTNLISVIVTDSGTPQMSATNSFSVVVYRPNTTPNLAALSDRTVYANTPLSFAVSATDTDQPPQSLTFSLGAGAPSGASISPGGGFIWTPTAAQAPSTNLISVIVTDSGTPQMSATNSFSVVVYRPNTPPTLAAISSQTVYANALLNFTASATDTDQPPQSLTFSLGAGAPSGASIAANGLFTWTPTAAQAPSTNLISVVVSDSGVPQMSATNSFSVVVYRPNTPPVLAGLSDRAVYANTLLSFAISATDTDQPPQSLTFSLDAGAPSGATVTTNGLFTWIPTAAQAPSTNQISVIVTDSGVPPMSATNSFSVVALASNTAPALVIQSASSPAGPFTDEPDAAIDTSQGLITVPRKSIMAFYRLSSDVPTRLTQVLVQGNSLVLRYERPAH